MHFCSRFPELGFILFFYHFYLQASTSSNKLMLLMWKCPEKNRNKHFLFYSSKTFFLILYITGAVRQTGRTKRIYEPLQQSTVLIYVHRLFRSIHVSRTHSQNDYFYTDTQKYSIMQYNMWVWIQLSLKTGFTSWKEIKFQASVQIIHSFCNANWRKSFLHD